MHHGSRKRVVIFSTAYEPFVGGAEIAIREITNGLGDFEFELLTARMDRKLPKKERVGAVMVYRIGVGIPMFDKALLALRGHAVATRLHKKSPYNVAWSMMASYGGFSCQKFCKASGVPYLLTLQEGDPIEFILKRVRMVRGWFNNIFTDATGLQTISTYLMNWGIDMGFKGFVKEVIPNGVSIDRFAREFDPQELAQIRDGFGFDNGAFVLVTASRLVVKNGVEHVIRALSDLPEHVCFVVCGTGELQSSLESLVEELGLKKRVLFRGNVLHDELPKVLQASDAFIRPSISEGLGNAFLEAMAAGIPTIGTPVGGIPDFLEDGKTGMLCEPGNPQSIVHAVQRAMSMDGEAREQMHADAMEVIHGIYNWTYIQGRMRKMFEQIV